MNTDLSYTHYNEYSVENNIKSYVYLIITIFVSVTLKKILLRLAFR